MATPFIRPFNFTTDHNPCLHVFFTTIDASVNHEPARTIGSYLWYKAYAYLTPSTCFVLDDGTGRAVGYIIGTPDTTAFTHRWTSTFTPVLDPVLVPPPSLTTTDPAKETSLAKSLRKAVHEASCSMLLSHPDILSQYPAHFHIDILPDYQKQGWGARLLSKFLEGVKERGAQGVHLGMVRGNEGARRFYEREGFCICGEVLDGGGRGREGESLCLVKTL